MAVVVGGREEDVAVLSPVFAPGILDDPICGSISNTIAHNSHRVVRSFLVTENDILFLPVYAQTVYAIPHLLRCFDIVNVIF